MDELAENCADLNDSKWQSGVGAEVLAEFIQQQMSLKWHESQYVSEDGSDGVDSGDGGDQSSHPDDNGANWPQSGTV